MAEGSPIRRIIATGLVLAPLLGAVSCKENPESQLKPGITSGDVFKNGSVGRSRHL